MATKTQEPQTPGERVERLREHFSVGAEFMADHLVKMSRQQVRRAETGAVKWKGTTTEAYAKGLELTFEQFKDFIEGRISFAEGLRLAEPAMTRLAMLQADYLRKEGIIERVAEKIAEVEPISERAKAMLWEFFDEFGWDMPETTMIAQALRFNRGLRELIARTARVSGSQPIAPK